MSSEPLSDLTGISSVGDNYLFYIVPEAGTQNSCTRLQILTALTPASGAGNNITLTATAAFSGSNDNGGNVIMQVGQGDGSGTPGNFVVQDASDHTFTIGTGGVGGPTIQAASNLPINFLDSGGTSSFNILSTSIQRRAQFSVQNNFLQIVSNWTLGWNSSSSDVAGGTLDTGLIRVEEAVVGVTNGSSGAGQLNAPAGVATLAVAGVPTDADVNQAVDGLLGVDTTSNTFYFRSSGTWTAAGGGGGGALVLLEEHTASNSTALDFTDWYSTNYDNYIVEFISLVPATNGDTIQLQCSINGGSTYDTGMNYATAFNYAYNASGNSSGAPTNCMMNFGDILNNAAWGLCGTAELYKPGGTTNYKQLIGQFSYGNSTLGANALLLFNQSCVYMNLSPVNALQISFAGGNITAGTVRIYGLSTTILGLMARTPASTYPPSLTF